MIRSDYILQMVEEFVRALSRINRLKREEQWEQADEEIRKELQRLFGGAELEGIESVSQTELLSQLIQSDSAFAVQEKVFMLATLLNEAGEVARKEGQEARAVALQLQGLNLLLDGMNRRGVIDLPDYAPKIEVFLQSMTSLGVEPPMRTYAMLMQYYEKTEQYGKAEDALFEMRDAEPGSRELKEFAISFYHRLLEKSEVELDRGGLPREEIESELERIRSRGGGEPGMEPESGAPVNPGE